MKHSEWMRGQRRLGALGLADENGQMLDAAVGRAERHHAGVGRLRHGNRGLGDADELGGGARRG